MKRLSKAFWFALTLRCEDADRIRCTPKDDARWHERIAERLHSALCKSCRAARRQLDVISDAIDANRDRFAAGGEHRLSPDARREILDQLRAEQEKL